MISSSQTENAEVLDQLITYLEDQDSGFVIVEVNEQKLQREAIDHIRSHFPVNQCHIIDLLHISVDASPLAAIRNSVADMPDAGIFLILNFHALAGNRRQDRIRIVRELNFSREAYYRLNKRLVFFLPTYFVDVIIRHAKDFFDFVPVTFFLKSELMESRDSVIEHRESFPDRKFLENQIAFLKDTLTSGDLNKEGKGEKHEILGDTYILISQYNDALESYRKSLSYYSNSKDRADVLVKIGRIQYIQGNIKNAEQNFRKSLAIYQDEGDRHSQAVTIGEIARILTDQGEMDEALHLHNERLSVFESLNDPQSKAITMGDIARTLMEKGELDNALKVNEAELRIYESIGDKKLKAIALGDIARILFEKGKVDEALSYHIEELKIFELTGDIRLKAMALGDIARILTSKGDTDKALSLYYEVLQVCENLGDTKGRAVILGDIANIHYSKGQIDSAFKLHEERLEVYRKMEDKLGVSSSLSGLAQIELQNNKIHEAREHLYESYAISLETGRLFDSSRIGLVLGKLLCQSGQTKEGIPILQHSLEGFTRLGQTRSATQVAELIDAFEKDS